MYNLSMPQTNIYWSDRGGAGSPINTLHITLRFLEGIDAPLLKKAADFVISNNDIFKLRIVQRDGEAFQDFCGAAGECAIDGGGYSDEELDAALLRGKTRIFDMAGPLCDFVIYRKTDGLCVLSITAHHIIIDGYGMVLLCDEILRVYALLLEGKTPAPETLPFADSLGAPEGENAENKAFWSGYFDGYNLGGRPFPVKYGVTAASAYKGQIETAGILDFCAKHGLTPYTVFTAALGIYLMNIYGADETAVIIPRLNREAAERKTLGCFVLPIPVRLKKTGDFAALCEQVKHAGKAASAHKKYDFSQIIEDFKQQFGTERPISDFTLNFQLKDVKNGISAKTDFSACGAMRNLLTLNISNYDGDDFYDITYDYRGDVLNETYIAFFHEALKSIIRQGLAGTPADEIKIVPEAELAYLENMSRGEAVPYDGGDTIVSLFRKVVHAAPSAPAVFTRGREAPMTFSELDALSDRIAASLAERGAAQGSLIGFLLERNAALVPAVLGILKAGCAFLPLDINHPKERVEYILKDSKARFIISAPRAAERFGIAYIDVNELLGGETGAPPDIRINQGDPAYCIYTSGTTGQPKGVLLAHRGIVNIVNPRNNPFNKAVCAGGTGVVAIGSVCFDISLFELFVFLLNGKFAAIAADDELADGEAIAGLFAKTGANALHCTPSRLQSYLSGGLFADILKTQIRMILSAGEALSSNLAALIAEYDIQMFNGYGPTETTIGATVTEAGDRETIGRPIANAAVYIVGAKKALLPFGVTGEIAVAGDGVGLGYLGNDKLTAEKFTVINGKRAYLTGDLGYFIPDGRLKYVARNDNQIKLRGYRIELAEIEQCALEYKEVENCAVIVKEINGEHYLILYFSGKDADSETLKERLKKFLSFYMVPQTVIKLPSLPTTINGKTDRAALASLAVSMERAYTPPSTKEEEALCAAFEAALAPRKVGADDNFFEIGGTSLLAVKMMMHANKYDLGVEYPDIFRYPTPRLLAKNLGIKRIQNYLPPLVSAHKGEFEKIDALLRQDAGGDFSRKPLGNVLVTGATGFLGSHIVNYLLKDASVGKIICAVRPKGKLTPEKRLKTTLFYYFADITEEQFADKVSAANGDITDAGFTAGIADEINTVINCAANVAHFAYGDALKSVNVDAVENLISFCKAKNAALIHISTVSVAGHNLRDKAGPAAYTERDLYKGQIISNEYIYSKFRAEYMVLKAKTEGLNAKIMRLGNLQGRTGDGEFQINLQKNAFARNIKAYAAIGMASAELRGGSVNITPVDETAKAVLLLAGLPESRAVFHVINPVPVPYDEIFAGLSAIGKDVRYVESGEFEALIGEYAKDSAQSKKVEGLLFEKSDIRLKEIPVDADCTVGVPKTLGFEFKAIEKDYIEKYLYMLNGLGFFD